MIVLVAAPAAAEAAPFVSVHATLERSEDDAVVSARVEWDEAAADYMSVGDLRLVAVSAHGHHPTVLDTATYDRIAAEDRKSVV